MLHGRIVSRVQLFINVHFQAEVLQDILMQILVHVCAQFMWQIAKILAINLCDIIIMLLSSHFSNWS